MRAIPASNPRVELALLSAMLVAACGGGDPGGPDPDPGDGSVTREIGPAGGTMTTPDNVLTLVFPAGALGTATTITVRPVANSAPNAVGPAYSIEPAGLTLAQPVAATFTLDESFLGGEAPEALGLAVRDQAGTWWAADLSSRAEVSDARTGAGGLRMPAVRRPVITVSGEFQGIVTQVTTTTFWRFSPQRPTVATGGNVNIQVLACIRERTERSAPGEAELGPLTETRTTCGPSIREGTWSVLGDNGDNLLGRVAALNPTSSARYDAPLQPPAFKPMLLVTLHWPERNLFHTLHVEVTVTGTNQWGGRVNWTITGTSSRRMDLPTGYEQEDLEREGSGTFELRAPTGMGPQVGMLVPVAIVGVDHYRRVFTRVTTGGGCTSTQVTTTDVSGDIQETRDAVWESPFGTLSIIFGANNQYALGFAGYSFDATGTITTSGTIACEGEDDLPLLPTTSDMTIQLGPDLDGSFFGPDGLYWTTLNPSAPNRLQGSTQWRDNFSPWATGNINWDLTRP